LHEKLPSALQVWHLRQCLPKSSLLGDALVDVLLDKRRVPHRSSKNFDTVWTPNVVAEVVEVRRFNASPVPHPRLARVKLDACSLVQRSCQQVVDRPDALRRGHGIHVVEVCKQVLPR
jgi:hypothetical protein